jgi:hypothetical protein
MTTVQELSRAEIVEFCRTWQSHLTMLEGKVDAEYLSMARQIVRPENFGWDGFGQLRPNKELARYDLYNWLVPAPGVQDVLLICQLTDREVRQSIEEDDPARIAGF